MGLDVSQMTVKAGSRDSSSKFPVMVFVHGESYEWNSGNPYDGSVLASYGGVVVVTINYRLGILGFLNANTDPYNRSPANYGLMDQIAALHWIQENIAFFGGDPSNVTIFGHGTGASCINFLMTSSAIPDGMLFHRAILMSGSSLSPWAMVQDPTKYAFQLARHVNCSPDLPHLHLLKCLREKPLEAILSTPIEAPEFVSTFAPSVDGVVIDSAHEKNIKKYIDRLGRYDLLFGVVKAESYFAFSAEDIQYGIETDRRSKILRTFVRNTYRYHLNEILATIVNEYTDWERPVQHPINIRDETLEALSDAQVVAPVVQTGDYHSSNRQNSYFYVFDYQTKFGDYPQRQGCIHGEELPYIFGVPLVGGLVHYPRNYTKSEMLLAEATMIYWSNFARTGNPNEPQEPEMVHGIRQERNRFKNIEWVAYEGVHKKYLNLDTKPKIKNHYRAHRLSFWLNLVPDLHRPGGEDVPRSHHLLDDHDDLSTYDGKVRAIPVSQVTFPELTPTPPLSGTTTFNLTAILGGRIPPPPKVTTEANRAAGPTQSDLAQDKKNKSAGEDLPEDGFAAYSTALSVTIAIGCSLLILNVLIFAGVYYQRDKHRLEVKKRNENGQMPNISGELEGPSIKPDIPPNPGGMKLDYGHKGKVASPVTQTQLPPPEFADLPVPPPTGTTNMSSVPRAPPPPKSTKPQHPESQPLLPQSIQLLPQNVPGPPKGTLKKSHKGQQIPNNIEELRV